MNNRLARTQYYAVLMNVNLLLYRGDVYRQNPEIIVSEFLDVFSTVEVVVVVVVILHRTAVVTSNTTPPHNI